MSPALVGWQAPGMGAAEGLLILVGTVVAGGLVVYLIVKLTDRW